MIYIIIISIVLFRIMVYKSMKTFLLMRKLEKQVKEVNEMFRNIEQFLDEINEKSS